MKAPVNLLWNIIGDFFTRSLDDDEKRPIESMWQAMSDLSGDVLSHIEGYKRLKSAYLASPFSNWGTIPTELSEVDISEDSIIIDINGRIATVYSREETNQFGGFLRVDNRDINYLSSNYRNLQSQGGYSTLAMRTEVSTTFNPSSANFSGDRWENQGSVEVENGSIDVPGLNWAILSDTMHMDGAHEWEQLWKVSVDEWTQGVSRRSISVNSFGDTGANFEVRVEHRNNRTEISSGSKALSSSIPIEFSGSILTRTSGGNFIRDGFSSGDTIVISGSVVNSGEYTIVNMGHDFMEVDDTFTSENTTNITILKKLNLMGFSGFPPSDIEFIIRYNRGVMNASVHIDGERYTQSESFRVSPGRRTQTIDMFNENHDLKVTPEFMLVKKGVIWENQAEPITSVVNARFTHVYETDLPIVDSGRIQTEPWDFSISAEVSKVGNEIHVSPDVDWLGYTPEYAWIGDCYCRLIDENKYKIISDGELKDEIRIFSTDVEWIDESTLASPLPLPKDIFIIDTEAIEYNLYNKLGRLMRLPNRKDSKMYLDSIRGMQSSLLSSPTENNIKRGISILLGAPYAEEAGFLSEVGEDFFILNGKRFDVSPFYTNFMSKRSRTVEHLEPLIDEVEIYDFIINHEEVKNVTNIWNSWTTFLVRISGNLSTNKESIENAIRLLRRVRDKRYDYIVEFFSRISDGEPLDDYHDGGYSAGNVGVYEDMVFDDGGAVVNNLTNQEKQTDSTPDEGWLDEGLALDSDLVRFKPKVLEFLENIKIKRHSVHINRDLSPKEVTDGFTMKTLRFGDSGGVKPTEIHRVLDSNGSLANIESGD